LNELFSLGALRIHSFDEWKSALTTGRFVLFVDGEWNIETAVFRPVFDPFADWCRQNAEFQADSVEMIAHSDDELSHAAQEMMRSNRIGMGGLKTYGGACRVIWLEDGRVLDYAWCWEVRELEQLKTRSKSAFSSEPAPQVLPTTPPAPG
jgi:hypothetical protein